MDLLNDFLPLNRISYNYSRLNNSLLKSELVSKETTKLKQSPIFNLRKSNLSKIPLLLSISFVILYSLFDNIL